MANPCFWSFVTLMVLEVFLLAKRENERAAMAAGARWLSKALPEAAVIAALRARVFLKADMVVEKSCVDEV